jgi:hypothetical protein
LIINNKARPIGPRFFLRLNAESVISLTGYFYFFDLNLTVGNLDKRFAVPNAGSAVAGRGTQEAGKIAGYLGIRTLSTESYDATDIFARVAVEYAMRSVKLERVIFSAFVHFQDVF